VLEDSKILTEKLCVPIDATIRQTMQVIGAAGLEIAFVVEGDTFRLVGTVSDGDIRRALLSGATLADPVIGCANRNCITIPETSGRSHALDQMRARGISQIPIVNEFNCLVGVHSLREILGVYNRPNLAVIMAGGRGERLRPLTDNVPKPMIKIAGRPILERLVLHLTGYGIKTIFLSVNYMSNVIQNHFGDGSKFGCVIKYLEEEQPLGTAGALSLLPEIPSHPFIVTNGDLITDFDVGAMLRFHQQKSNAISIGVRQYQHTVPFGVLDMSGDLVVAVREKPSVICETNAGVYVLSPALVERVRKDTPTTMPELVSDCLARNENVGGFRIEGDWIDVGRPADLAAASGISVV
jgi:dTDP-glucose pyrophosphorylase/CBS domain-containing protein